MKRRIFNVVMNALITITSVVGCYVGLFFINYLILEIITGGIDGFDIDPAKTGKIFYLFYTISSNEGYDPVLSDFNICLTI